MEGHSPRPSPTPGVLRPSGWQAPACSSAVDRGSRRTAPEECDHIPQFEKAFAEAIEATHECVPPDAGAGSLEFVADLELRPAAKPRHGRAPA